MTGGDASLHSVGERSLDDGIEQKMAGVEVLVDMHVEWQAASLREFEQEIEKNERLIGILRNAADDIGAGSDRRLEPAAGRIELSRRVAGQMRDDLQREAVATTLPQLNQRFNAANVTFSFDVGVAADRNRSARETGIERAFGPRHDFFARCGRCERTIAGRGALQRGARILDEPPRARLVEVLMGIDQARHNKPAIQIDDLRCSVTRVSPFPARQCGHPPRYAISSRAGCLAPGCSTRPLRRRSETPLKEKS